MNAPQGTVRVVMLDTENRYRHYARILDDSGFECIDAGLIDFSDRDLLRSDFDVAVCSQEFDPLTPLRIQSLKEAGVPTCHVMDGVLEWKNLWENPRSFPENDGPPIYEPVLSDSVICMGTWQAELLKMLGAPGTCHPVGLPRLDAYADLKPRPESERTSRILVSTANTLGFSESHYEVTINGLREFHQVINRVYPELNITWRIDEQVASEIGIPSAQIQPASEPLPSIIGDFDVLFSTPSTILLEGMLAGLRVCQLNFTASPQMIQTVWSIDTIGAIADVIGSVQSPTSNHIRYQEMLRDHQVARPGDSADALVTILRELAQNGIASTVRKDMASLEGPKKLLSEGEAKLLQIQIQRMVKQHEKSFCTRVRRLFQRLLKRFSLVLA